MKTYAALTLLAILMIGCDTLKGPNQGYIAPAVEGRVVDARSGAPLPDVIVKRYLEKPERENPLATHGASKLMQVPFATTDAQGHFLHDAERGGYLLFEHPGAYEIYLVLQRKGYETLTTNIDLVKIKPVKTNDLLIVHVGDLPLESESEP